MNNTTSLTLKQRCQRLYKLVVSSDALLAIALTAILVIVALIIGIESSALLKLNGAKHARYLADPNNRLSFLANWDGVDYLKIALSGYSTKFLTGWLPVYPILINLIARVIRSYLVSALIISWASLAGAIYYYLKIVKLYFKLDSLEAVKAAALFVLFPTGIYLLSAYTESLFALLSLGAIYYAMQKKFLPAALLLMIATATHINGLYMLLLVAVLLQEAKVKIRYILSTLIIGSLGLISYMVYLLYKYKDAFAFIDAQKDHGWLHTSISNNLSLIGPLNFILLAAVLMSAIYWWKKKRSFSVYAALYLLIPLIGGQFGGFPRYTLMVFPLQYMLYLLTRGKKFAYPAILIFFILSWLYILIRFSTGYIVG